MVNQATFHRQKQQTILSNPDLSFSREFTIAYYNSWCELYIIIIFLEMERRWSTSMFQYNKSTNISSEFRFYPHFIKYERILMTTLYCKVKYKNVQLETIYVLEYLNWILTLKFRVSVEFNDCSFSPFELLGCICSRIRYI